MTALTIFSAPKPFTHPHIALIQRNAIRSWKMLGERVEVILMGEEEGLAQASHELGVQHLPLVKRNAQGTPLISAMFALARTSTDSPLLACVNADILLLPDFIDCALKAAQQAPHFLLVGQRWDLEVTEPVDFSVGWESRLMMQISSSGRLHPPAGSDYFIFPRSCYTEIPDFAIGRAGWDNWMIYEARQRGWPVVDATGAIHIIHQNHDYSHLPGGQPHYRLPETFENTRLAGGKRHIFHLIDCDRRMEDGRIQPSQIEWKKFWREVEIFPLVKLHSEWLGQLFYAVFHPIKAYREFRAWMKKKSAAQAKE